MVKFTEEIVKFIKINATGLRNNELANLVNSNFNTNFNASQIKNFKSRNHITSGLNTCFIQGNTPHNKGKKQVDYMSDDAIEKTKATRFKKGNIPHNHRPVGSERTTRDGFIEIKIAEPNSWNLKHRVVWEKENGVIPEGMILRFLDGNPCNCNIENLILVSRAENAVLNRHFEKFDDAELSKTKIALARLNVQTSKRKK